MPVSWVSLWSVKLCLATAALLSLPLMFIAGNTTDILGRLPLLWLVAGSRRWSCEGRKEKGHQEENASRIEANKRTGCVQLLIENWRWGFNSGKTDARTTWSHQWEQLESEVLCRGQYICDAHTWTFNTATLSLWGLDYPRYLSQNYIK